MPSATFRVTVLALLAYAGYQLTPACRDDTRVRGVDAPVVLSCLANGAWIAAWHHERFALSLALMLTLLASLIAVYLRLDIRRAEAGPAQRWLVELPFSIYLGWITVATVADVSVVLLYYGWDGWGLDDFTWLVIMLGVALALAAAVAWTRRDIAYLAVLIWAFVGIAVKHEGPPAVAAAVAASVVALLLLGSAMLGRPEAPVPSSR